jgi:hypothetical protein
VESCAQGVPPALTRESLCLDHYIDQAFARLQAALELCHRGGAVEAGTLDWLFNDAEFAVQSLCQNGFTPSAAQRVRVLELLLGLTNLREYLRHHSIAVRRKE